MLVGTVSGGVIAQATNLGVPYLIRAAMLGVTLLLALLRQAFVNGIIPSEQRATVLSFDNLMASAGGVVTQPALGRAADLWGYEAQGIART